LMARFKPQQRMSDVPGVVSVMALPYKADTAPPNPRPDRPFLQSIFSYLDTRRPIATELYVIGCEYVPLAVSVAVSIRDGFGPDAVLTAVATALRQFLWPLAPGGLDGSGWTLGRSVRDLELEVAVARVAGVSSVNGFSLFQQDLAARWQLAPRASNQSPREIALQAWQLPELLGVMVVAGNTPADLTGVAQPADGGIAIPVSPEVC
jgi:hypothetical protein